MKNIRKSLLFVFLFLCVGVACIVLTTGASTRKPTPANYCTDTGCLYYSKVHPGNSHPSTPPDDWYSIQPNPQSPVFQFTEWKVGKDAILKNLDSAHPHTFITNEETECTIYATVAYAAGQQGNHGITDYKFSVVGSDGFDT